MSNGNNWYEILVPDTIYNRQIPLSYHHKWDKKVAKIAKGLTIYGSVIGYWLSTKLLREPMISVKIACSEKQINEIVKMTIKHYKQKEIIYVKLSNEVYIRKAK